MLHPRRKYQRNRFAPGTPERARIEARYIPEPNSGCWLWIGYTDWAGYGRLKIDGRDQSAHRLSWRIYRGDIPDNQCVLHRCDVPQCVNPDHLFLGTQADNMKDMAAKKRSDGGCRLGSTGERHWLAKLTAEDVRQIRADDRYHRVIADEYAVARSVISAIKRRSAWRHVP